MTDNSQYKLSRVYNVINSPIHILQLHAQD